MLKIGLASDHAGFELKEFIKKYIIEKGYQCIDFGAYTADPSDYPDFAHPLARAVETGDSRLRGNDGEANQLFSYSVIQSFNKAGGVDMGIAMCGSGNGISMTLNKHQGIRAAICWNEKIAQVTRAHNDANILVLPARFISHEEATAIVNIFLHTPFEGGRHQRRIEKIPI